ncbi:MAG: FmdB family zinc ribbon protein [Armatimonadota bacterium]
MPTYVYRCRQCEHQFEMFQKITDDPIAKCPKCDGAVSRLLFPVGIVFKGSGFHVNDYPSSSSENKKTEERSEIKEPAVPKE